MGFREGVTMSLRFTFSTSALRVAVMFAGISALLWGQAPKAAVPGSSKAWTVPRTPGGHPDFQGYWTNSTYTPLERPTALGTKEFDTEAEGCRTPFNPWDARSPLCVGLVLDCAMFTLVRALPSPASVED